MNGQGLDLRLLLATARPAVRAFFESLGFRVGTIAVGGATEEVAHADVVVVDAALDPIAAIEFCGELHARRPELPIVALVCCPQALAPSHLHGLLAAGAGSVIDLGDRGEETRRAVLAAARGETVLHLQLGRGGDAFLRDVLSARPARRELQLRLLELVALGLSDREIGNRLHLSPHTVKHSTEQLRAALGVRNRTELAAWAGRSGFYAGSGSRGPAAAAGTAGPRRREPR
jgi:two-component system response regulator DevR